MATWLYQINQQQWPPERYRLEIWEGERWRWPVGNIRRGAEDADPRPGDTVVFFYAPTGGVDPGFYGWAVVLEWLEQEKEIYFRPVSPSDWLKMDPWWDEEASSLANEIRGRMKQGTMWRVDDSLVPELRDGIAAWLQSGRDRPRRDHLADEEDVAY